nr:MAG TPA: NTP-PPase-like protein [Caudoviricetes sp.]
MCKTTDIIDTRLWQKLSARIHKASLSKGFWDEDQPLNHCIMLVVCELCEAIDADRKGRYAKKIVAIDQLYDHAFPIVYETHIKGSVEEELADTAMRLLDIIARMGWVIDDIVRPSCVSFSNYGSFPLLCYSITEDLVCREFGDRYAVLWAFYKVLAIAYQYDIDLLEYIELKMRYNKHRPKLHGRRY